MEIVASWKNAAGQTVVQHAGGLAVLPKGWSVESWQIAQARRDAGRQAAAAEQSRIAEVERALAGSNCVALMNGAGKVAVFAVPTPVGGGPDDAPAPGAVLSPFRRHELEVQRDLLRAIADDKMSSAPARTKARLEADKLDKLLRLPNQPA